MKKIVKKLLRKFGYKISRLEVSKPKPSPVATKKKLSKSLARRKSLFETYGIDLVLDIGANTGQYAQQTRTQIWFQGEIISFEPMTLEFEKMEAKAKNDERWTPVNCAIGDKAEELQINIAGISYSSSILGMLKPHELSAPKSRYVGEQTVKVATLDAVMNELAINESNIYLKIDTQGYESKVLKGAEKSLARIDTIQLEMSLTPLYEGELLFNDLFNLLSSKGYSLVAIEPGFSDKDSGRLLQVDGIFHRFSN